MNTPNRSKHSSIRETVNNVMERIESSTVAVTARLRRDQRLRRSGLLSFGSQRRKVASSSKPVKRSKPTTRNKTSRTHTMSSIHTRSAGSQTPVLIRGGMANLPVKPRKLGAPPKRRYNVALNVPGAELHLPAIPAFNFSWRLVSGVLTGLLLILAVYLWTSPKYRVELVEVAGLQRLTVHDINTVVGISGQSIFSANPQQIKLALEQAFPELKAVSVKVSLPAQVVVKAQERQPVIAWNQDGREQWVDTEGMAFTPRGEAGALIVVEAKNSPPTIDKTSPMDLRFIKPEMVGVIGRMALNAPKNTPLLYDYEHGLGWTDPSGWQVYFGMDISDMEAKLLVYQALVSKLQKDGVQPVLISVEYLHAPYYRTEQ